MQLSLRSALALGLLAACPSAPSTAEKAAPSAPRCPLEPALVEADTFDRAEDALKAGAAVVSFDASGCRVLRAVARDAGLLVFQLETRSGAAAAAWVSYRRELGPSHGHTWLDRDGDGAFETELIDAWSDAGWTTAERIDRPDGGPWLRVREERVRFSLRTLRQAWLDGGWVTTEDVVGPARPEVVPIAR